MPEFVDLRMLSSKELAAIGLEQVAYIKKVALPEGLTGFGIFSADGHAVAMAQTAELAEALIRQHELEPVQVH